MAKVKGAYVSDEQRAAIGEAFRNSLPDQGKSERLEFLCTLFPSRANALQGKNVWGGEAWHQQVSRRGVSTAAGYDAYFSMLPAEDTVPKAWIDEAAESLEDRERLVEGLDRALTATTPTGRRLIGPYLEQLHYRLLGSKAATSTNALLVALFDRGENILGLERDGEILGPRAQMTFLIRDMLSQWGPDDAGTRLVSAFRESSSPAFCAALFVERGSELGIFEYPNGNRPEPVVTPDTFAQLGEAMLELIVTHYADGTLGQAHHYSEIAEAWTYLAGPEAPRSWLMKGIFETPIFLAKIASSLIGYSIGTSKPSYFVSRLPMDPWLDVDLILAAATKFVGHPDLHGSNALIIEAVARDLPEKLRAKREADAETATRREDTASPDRDL